jgi:hypothetical protein
MSEVKDVEDGLAARKQVREVEEQSAAARLPPFSLWKVLNVKISSTVNIQEDVHAMVGDFFPGFVRSFEQLLNHSLVWHQLVRCFRPASIDLPSSGCLPIRPLYPATSPHHNLPLSVNSNTDVVRRSRARLIESLQQISDKEEAAKQFATSAVDERRKKLGSLEADVSQAHKDFLVAEEKLDTMVEKRQNKEKKMVRAKNVQEKENSKTLEKMEKQETSQKARVFAQLAEFDSKAEAWKEACAGGDVSPTLPVYEASSFLDRVPGVTSSAAIEAASNLLEPDTHRGTVSIVPPLDETPLAPFASPPAKDEPQGPPRFLEHALNSTFGVSPLHPELAGFIAGLHAGIDDSEVTDFLQSDDLKQHIEAIAPAVWKAARLELANAKKRAEEAVAKASQPPPATPMSTNLMERGKEAMKSVALVSSECCSLSRSALLTCPKSTRLIC